MEYCCKKMKFSVHRSSVERKYGPDDVICYVPQFDEYGIVIHDSGKSYIQIDYCPWCGSKLPNSKRDLWFEKLEELGIECPFEDEIPIEFRTEEWWKNVKQ